MDREILLASLGIGSGVVFALIAVIYGRVVSDIREIKGDVKEIMKNCPMCRAVPEREGE
jgi:hypothetical protein